MAEMDMVNAAVIRAAVIEDAPAIAALVNAAFVMERAFVDRDRTSVEEITRLLGTGTFVVVDGDGGRLAACMYIEARGARAYLGMLAVDPANQKRGLGREMMAAAERQCAALGCTAIDIRIVDRRTELPPFYRRLGFVERGTAPFDDPLLTRPCHFVLMSKELSAGRKGGWGR
jgi:GNAT superfamily N-acetyltransferase